MVMAITTTMSRFSLLAAALLCSPLPGLAAAAAVTTLEVAPIVPGAYIVEFEDAADDSPAFYSNLTGSSIDATPRMKLAHQLFNGASFQLSEAHDNDTSLEIIQSMAVVRKIWPVRLYQRPAAIVSSIHSSLEGATPLKKRATTSGSDDFSTHIMGGVSELRAEGYAGDGIFIGVVDTGVDYNHPALGGGFGPGYKVVAGYDLVGDAYDGTNALVPDPNPMDCDGHGTHVSGIIGADPNPYNFTGVAPNATLGMWKVFGCEGSASNEVLIAAFNMAYEAGVDVISSSIGGASGWTEDAWDVTVQRIVEKGVPCIIANGNDGSNGVFYSSAAAEAIGATGVGSIDNIIQPVFLTKAVYLLNGGSPTEFGYSGGALGDFGTNNFPLIALGFDTTITADACTALPDTTPDLSSYVVLIRRGSCTFDIKIANAQAKGAKRILFYNNVPGVPSKPGDSSLVVPVAMVSNVQGASWIASLSAGVAVTIEFTVLAESSTVFEQPVNKVTAGFMSTFSSWGPTYEAWIKPQVSAPGGFILATYPLNLGAYAVLSGTSMATPFIGGVVALLREIRGKSLDPNTITTLLATTATPRNWGDGTGADYGVLAPVVQQGGGLVDAHTAAHITTILDVANIALNDTAYFTAAHPVTIKNTGSTAVTYTFSNIGAATAYTLTSGAWPDSFPPTVEASYATIRFNPSTLTVPAGAALPVVLHFTRPAGLDAARIPVYSGYVGINSTNGDYLTLPYAGIASKLKEATVTDSADGFPYLSTSADADHAPIAGKLFTLPGNSTTYIATEYPSVVWALAMGSKVVRVDIVPLDVHNLPRIIGKQVLGSMAGYPIHNNARAALISSNWNGQLSDGSWAPAGTYKFFFRALKIFGDETYDHDYEPFSTEYFSIAYAP